MDARTILTAHAYLPNAFGRAVLWLDSEQPEKAILDPGGITLAERIPTAVEVRLTVRPDYAAQIVIGRPLVVGDRMLGPVLLADVTAWETAICQSSDVLRFWHWPDGGGATFVIDRVAGECLRAAIDRYRRGCPGARYLPSHCDCGWDRTGRKVLKVPLGWVYPGREAPRPRPLAPTVEPPPSPKRTAGLA